MKEEEEMRGMKRKGDDEYDEEIELKMIKKEEEEEESEVRGGKAWIGIMYLFSPHSISMLYWPNID